MHPFPQPMNLSERRRLFLRSLGFGLFLFSAVLGWNAPEAPARPLSDPVEELRKVLKVDPTPSLDEQVREEQKRFRTKALEKQVTYIKSLGDLARALLLHEWRDQYIKDAELAAVDANIRSQLALRLETELREALKKDSVTQWAAANMIGRTASEARKNSGDWKRPGPGLLVRDHLKKLGPDLARLTEHQDKNNPGEAEDVRRAAAAALGQVEGDPEKELVAALEKMLATDTRAGRRAAAEALANMMRILAQPERKNEYLTKMGQLRKEVEKAGSNVVKVASKYLNDPDPEVSRLCTEAMLLTATALAGEVLNVDQKEIEVFPPPGRKPSMTERDRMKFYADGVKAEREDLVPLMKALQASVPALIKAAQDPLQSGANKTLVFATLEQMGHAREKLILRYESVPAHVKDPPDPKEKVGKAAPGNAIQRVRFAEEAPKRLPDDPLLDGLQKAIDLMTGSLDATNTELLLAALHALETIGPYAEKAAPRVGLRLVHPDHLVRRASARLLGKIGPVKGSNPVPQLARMLEADPDLDARLAAAIALERLGPSATEAIPSAIKVIENPRHDVEIRTAAIQTLRGIGTDAAKKGVPALAFALADSDARVRREAVEALYHFGKEAGGAREALRKAVRDPDPEVSRIASEALLQLNP